MRASIAGLFGIAATSIALLSSTAQAVPFSLLPKPHPLVIWHGLGDSAHSEGIDSFMSQLKEAFPGLYIHSVTQDATSDSEDRRQGFFGHVNDQIQTACDQLAAIEELKHGFDAIGFSQGGQFLRAYVQRCNTPRVRNLVTFGSQHMGIADLPACGPTDLLCRVAEAALRGGIYTDYAQSHLVSAQYYRNPKDPQAFASYLEKNDFIKDINNEAKTVNATYAKNLASLENFVMLMFDKDTTVEPKQSSWFASYPIRNQTEADSVGNPDEPIPLRQSSIYLEDRIGLKKLDQRGSLVMELCHGIHMQIDPACQFKVFGKYIGTPSTGLNNSVAAWIDRTWRWMLYKTTGLRVEETGGLILTQTALFLGLFFSIRVILVLVVSGIQRVSRKDGDQGVQTGPGPIRLA
ncbi:related to palmitoyl-protein thioesterase 1 [Melanopsichium pennsylvanicum]|uniref:Palmitoyl-protein thioesterase 1 n=2 Tax=Melanopsichium pennsylvanicum TaxID=63383 RepID=A0AAJ4XQY3_9BASI|nr:related to palmitoyl-protein thioesterase 1 [Melanopsichium pennsylvanicum 4]SNX86767.1 related to palmitoyl-protein thioesterase 1 [Melanopsichium pennsylvanicum]